MELPFERQAMRNEIMPGNLRIYEQSAYQALRFLYALYQHNSITKEAAMAEKKQIVRQYERAKADFEQGRALTTHYARLRRETEAAANAFGRERTLENAEKVMEALYQCGMGKGDVATQTSCP